MNHAPLKHELPTVRYAMGSRRSVWHLEIRSRPHQVVEDAMQVLRDRESRDAPSNSIAHFEMWEAPSAASLLDKHARAEVVSSGNSACDRSFSKGPMFQQVHASSGEKDSVGLRSVLKRQDWVTHNAQSVKHIYSEMELLAQLHENDLWEYSGNSWQVALLPEGGIIIDSSGGTERYGMVVRIFDGAALVWPAERVANDMVELDLTSRLQWKIVVDSEAFAVLPTECLSPLGAIAVGWSAARIGPLFRATGPAEPLLQFQGRVGWKGVPEIVMRKLMTMLEVQMPDTSDIPNCSLAEAMAAALSLKVCEQHMDRATMQEILLGRLLNDEIVEQGFLDDLSDEMVNDVVLMKDQRDARQFLKAREEAKTKRECRRRQALKLVETVVKVAGASKPKQLKAPAPAKTATKDAKQQSRVYADMDDEPIRLLLLHKPDRAKVVADSFNGRYRLWYPGGLLKSVSWTGRGHLEAVRVALKQLWQWEQSATDRGAPPHTVAVIEGTTT